MGVSEIRGTFYWGPSYKGDPLCLLYKGSPQFHKPPPSMGSQRLWSWAARRLARLERVEAGVSIQSPLQARNQRGMMSGVLCLVYSYHDCFFI